MDCEKALELMSAELDGMCTEQERAALQAHLETCADAVRPTGSCARWTRRCRTRSWSRRRRWHDNVMRQIRKEKKPARRVWLPAAAIAAAAALVLLAGQAGILSLPGFDRENSVTVNVGSAAERIFERIEPEAGEPGPGCRGGSGGAVGRDAARRAAPVGAGDPGGSCARRRMRRRRLARGSTA